MGGERKLILVTGGNSGIGLEACKILCAQGHKVVATVRSDEKGSHTLTEVKAYAPNADISYLLCEMTDPKSIKAAAEEFKAKWLVDGQMLDTLINNAGVNFQTKERVVSSINPEWEQTVVVNAMAPIMLTDLLLDNLKETAAKKGEARILMVNSSVSTNFESMNSYQTDMNDPMLANLKKHDGMTAYKNSKVILMLATHALTEEIADTGVKLSSMCPGMVAGTNLALGNADESMKGKIKCMICCMNCFMSPKSNAQGGQYIVDIAESPLGGTLGNFYVRGKLTALTPQLLVKENQKKMLALLRQMAAH